MPFQRQYLVLCVDDDPIIIDTFTRAFKDQPDCFLDIAMDQELAAEKLRSASYDIVFLDMSIGGIRLAGIAILEEIRRIQIEQQAQGKLLRKPWIVIMSATVCLNDFSRRANELKVFCFIDKPVDFSEDFICSVVNQFGVPLLPRHEIPPRPEFPT